MNTLPTRHDLYQLLANTGVTLPESKPVVKERAVIWAVLVLIHFTLLLGIGDLLVRLWPLIHY
ncbi:hypothetical protein [Spirosoma panaciterrae]|uniref:hypothetical protein n=1 Tax=Spirosoma panaciterrae TaxID=496058 RepID=UPI000366507D|nr:hypothetical protein [Spirosoma panaciterrae]